MPEARLETWNRPFSCTALAVTLLSAACGGGSGGDDQARISIAITSEASDVSHLFLTSRETGFVALRRPDGPVVYFVGQTGELVRFDSLSASGTALLSAGPVSITRADLDSDGGLELVVQGPWGTETYEPDAMPSAMPSEGVEAQSHALAADDLGELIDEVIEDLVTLRHDPKMGWIMDLIEAADEAGAAFTAAVAELDRTVSEWVGRDPTASSEDHDRELVSNGPIAVPQGAEAESIPAILREAHDRVSGGMPETTHITSPITEIEAMESPVDVPDAGSPGAPEAFKCRILYRGSDRVLALEEQACVASEAECAAEGGEVVTVVAASADECADWCQVDIGVHFASSELDDSNLKCFRRACVSQPGLESSPEALTGDDACAAGCAAPYCEQAAMPKEAFFEAELDGMQVTSAGLEEHGLRSSLERPVDADSGWAVLRIDLGDQDIGFTIGLEIHLPSPDFVGSCDTTTVRPSCAAWYDEYDADGYSAQYSSFFNSVDVTGHGPGSIEITSMEGGWIEGTWDTKMYSYNPVRDPDGMPMHSTSGSFRVQKSSQWSWWPGELP